MSVIKDILFVHKEPKLLLLAKIQFALGDFEKCVKHCESIKAIKYSYETKAHENDGVEFILAQIDVSNNKLSEALEKISKAIELNPGFQEYLIYKKMIEKMIENKLLKQWRTKPHDVHFLYV